MRLIDADEIVYHTYIDAEGKPITQPIVNKGLIDLQPTIDSIPADWLYGWAADHGDNRFASYIYDCWQDYCKSLEDDNED